MDETCTAGKKYGKETVKGDPTRGQDSIGGRAEGEREGNVTRWLPPYACYSVTRRESRSSRAHGRGQQSVNCKDVHIHVLSVISRTSKLNGFFTSLENVIFCLK
jgi:hypothetical protein